VGVVYGACIYRDKRSCGEMLCFSGALAGQTVFNATQDALMFTSRPKFKNIIGVNYDIDFGFLFYNNLLLVLLNLNKCGYNIQNSSSY
jgi:hypothetical protein